MKAERLPRPAELGTINVIELREAFRYLTSPDLNERANALEVVPHEILDKLPSPGLDEAFLAWSERIRAIGWNIDWDN